MALPIPGALVPIPADPPASRRPRMGDPRAGVGGTQSGLRPAEPGWGIRAPPRPDPRAPSARMGDARHRSGPGGAGTRRSGRRAGPRPPAEGMLPTEAQKECCTTGGGEQELICYASLHYDVNNECTTE